MDTGQTDSKVSLAVNNAPQLDPIFDFTSQEEAALSPIVRACLKVARESHKGETRRKDFHMPYIHHVIAACKLLQASGTQEPINLGAALLHDALEQGVYLNRESKFKDRVYNAIVEEYVVDGKEKPHAVFLADAAIDRIFTIVSEVTNDRDDDDKWFGQADKVDGISKAAKRVKMADLTANVLDDLLYGCTSSVSAVRDMHNRMRSIAMQCAPARPTLFGLFDVVFKRNQAALSNPKKQSNLSRIDVLAVLDQMKEEDVDAHLHEPSELHWINDKELHTMSGVVSAGVNDSGKVVAFRMAVAPQNLHSFSGIPEDVNQVAYALRDALASHKPEAHRSIKVGPVTIFEDRLVTRKMTLNKPMDIGAFTSIALRNNAVTKGFGIALERHSSGVIQERDVAVGGWHGFD